MNAGEGCPTRAVTPPTSDTLASRREGGLGLLLVKKLMDHISYQRAGGTNRLKPAVQRPDYGKLGLATLGGSACCMQLVFLHEFFHAPRAGTGATYGRRQ